MKRLLSILLVFSVTLTMTVFGFAGYAQEKDFLMTETGLTEDHDGCAEETAEQDLSGEVFEDLFGDGSAYQVAGVQEAEGAQGFSVSYIAAGDCDLSITAYEEDNDSELWSADTAAAAGSGTVFVSEDGAGLPEYYWLEATLTKDGRALSEAYCYLDHTRAYEDFLNTKADDEAFADNVVLDYGTDESGTDHFAVVAEDVRVIRVESMDDVDVVESETGETSLFSFGKDQDSYTIHDAVNEDALGDVAPGDKVVILPEDDMDAVRMLVVDDVDAEENTAEPETSGAVTLTAADEEAGIEDFFEFVKIDVTVEADTEDVDTSDCSDGMEFLDEEVVDPNAEEDAELMSKTISAGPSGSTSITFKKSFGAVTVKDTVSLTCKASLKINYDGVKAFGKETSVPKKLNSVTASSTMTAKNVFNIAASKAYSGKLTAKIGTIQLGTYYGVTFSIPVEVVAGYSAGAKLDFTATQTASGTVTATYSNGKYSVSTSKSASSTKSIETQAKASVSLGIKPAVQASALSVITVSVAGEAGVRADGTVESINKTKTYKHEGIACLTVSLKVYIIPSFKLQAFKKTLAEKTWSGATANLLTFYAHLGTNGKWSYGTGHCPYRQYLISLKVYDRNTKNGLSDVTVKEGSSTLGKSNAKGDLSVWMKMASHTLKFSKSRYTTGTLTFTVGGAGSQSIKLYRSGANEEYHTMSYLTSMSAEDLSALREDEDLLSNTIFNIESADDLAALAEFANANPTQGFRFALNGSEAALDLSDMSWTPIGTEANPFRGELNGSGFTITGLEIDGSQYAGLFGNVEGALIHDLTFEDAQVSGGDFTGILAGHAGASSKIYDIAATGGSVSGGTGVGGLIGAMDQAELLNSYSTAAVTAGSQAGGITGAFTCTDELGQISNCYSAGAVSGSEAIGGIAGLVTIGTASLTEDEEDAAHTVGINYAYYLEGSAPAACTGDSGELPAIVFAVTEAQALGMDSDQFISEEDGYANAVTLLDALNNWYAANGSFTGSGESEAAEGESDTSEESGTDAGIPEASANDYYNHWYADTLNEDGAFANGGTPVFAEKAAVYMLNVYYVYEDGTEAAPDVTLYLTEGQAYDVDSYKIEGYHTYEEEYKGYMPANDLEYRVIYIEDNPYDGSVSDLSSSSPAEAGKSYSVSSEADLVALSGYTNAGGNTSGAVFVLTDAIGMTFSGMIPIGTEAHPFMGTFDGQYNTISGLTDSLFGSTLDAEITSLNLESSIDGSNMEYAGAAVAKASETTIRNCTAAVSVTGSADYAGGIAGAVSDGVLIDQCTVSGSVAGDTAGGIVGMLSGGMRNNIRNCAVEGTVAATACAGGLLGSGSDFATVANNYVTADVSASANAGGIAGSASGLDLLNMYFYGNVSAAAADAVYAASESANQVSGVWYVYGSTSCQDAEQIPASGEGISILLSALNHWVVNADSSTYLTWSANRDEENGLPVFGTGFENWVTDFALSYGQVTYIYNDEYYSQGTPYLALYDADGKMISASKLNVDETFKDVPLETASAKIYLLEGMTIVPICEAAQASVR